MNRILRRLIGVRATTLNQTRTGAGTSPRLFKGNGQTPYWFLTAGLGLSLGSGWLVYKNWKDLFAFSKVHALRPKKKDEEIKTIKLTSRERRFLRFASVEYDGQLYMTPQDFLESVVEAEPRPRLKRRNLSRKDLDLIRDTTPPLQKGSPQMFRNLRDKGIVSYTEYLFLLSILTKPQTGFRIAFNMFDTDGNEKVDKSEFLVLLYLIPLHSYRQESAIQKMHLFVRNSVESSDSDSNESSLQIDKLELTHSSSAKVQFFT